MSLARQSLERFLAEAAVFGGNVATDPVVECAPEGDCSSAVVYFWYAAQPEQRFCAVFVDDERVYFDRVAA